MSRSFRDTLWLIGQALGRDIINDRPDPTLVALAARGYHIQTDVLRIPARLHYFSDGPPQLQSVQGATCIISLGVVAVWVALYMLVILQMKSPRPTLGLLALLVFGVLGLSGAFWVGGILQRIRLTKPSHD